MTILAEGLDDSEYHLDPDQLAAGMVAVRESPRDRGTVEMLVVRPEVGARVVVDEVDADTAIGLAGDNWLQRYLVHDPDTPADPEDQVTVMNARFAFMIAGSPERAALAGDQVYVDLDLGVENLPAGTEIEVGEVVLRVSAKPHTGCKKFIARFGLEAQRMTAQPEGKALRLRGINARIMRPGTIRVGDAVVVRRPAA